jgi:GntR family transcriptional regulator
MSKPTRRQEPLYIKARGVLMDRIRSGAWAPGTALPNEFELADELGMSQGTVRKSLDQLVADGLVVRHQGRGTFVADRTPEQWQFRFFNFYDSHGRRIIPEGSSAKAELRPATPSECQMLKLPSARSVVAISRTRSSGGLPFVAERLLLPAARFPGIEKLRPVPNTLYDHYRRQFSVIVARAEDRLTAVAAGKTVAERLAVAIGTPLLRVDRIAYDIDDNPVEWRTSSVRLDQGHYLAHLK